MKLKKKSKILITSIIIIIITFSCNVMISLAALKDELQNKESETERKIEETKEEISDVKEEMSQTMQEVQNLIGQISEYEVEIATLDIQISEINVNIEETQEKLDKTQKDLEEKQKLLDQRLVALYESGSTTYMDVLLNSKSLTDFISNYYLIEELASYDTELIETIEKTKQEIEEAKTQLETSKTELEQVKERQIAKQNALTVVKTEKDNKVASLSQEERELEKQLTQFEQDKKEISNRLADIAAQEVTSNNSSGGGQTTIVPSIPSASGYIFPVAGLSKANINNKTYPSYPGHTGVDVNINVIGKSVVAVKSGTVVISKALRNPNGSYKSYGEYVVINHHDGTQTLYAHMLAGSRTVSEGQTVSQGQVIGTVGSTGNSSGPHLHFGVYINNKRSFVNPLPYLP